MIIPFIQMKSACGGKSGVEIFETIPVHPVCVRVQHIQKLPVLFYFIVLPGRKTDFGYPYLLFHFEMIQDVSHFLDLDRKSTRLNSSHVAISYAVFCLKKKSRLMD